MKPQPVTNAVVSRLLLLAAKPAFNHRQRGVQHAVGEAPFVITPDQCFDQVLTLGAQRLGLNRKIASWWKMRQPVFYLVWLPVVR